MITPTFDVMQTKKLRKLVESVLGWTIDEDAEIDEDDEVSICHYLLLVMSTSLKISQYSTSSWNVCMLVNLCLRMFMGNQFVEHTLQF